MGTHRMLINPDAIVNISRSGNTFTATQVNGGTFTFTQTDTKNTAGSTNSSSKLFLIGATSQATNPQTYSHDTVYVGTDGCLYSNSTKVSVEGHTHSYVPTSRTVNGKALSGNITLNYTDVGAAPASHGTHVTTATVKSALGTGSGTTKFLREDGSWATPAYYTLTKAKVEAVLTGNITSHTHSYLPLAGGTLTGKLQVNAPIFGYNYTNSNNMASFIFDKPSTNYTGIGACGENDTIYLGACNAEGEWVTSYRQIWKFNGSLVVGGGDDTCCIRPWTNNYSTIGTESFKWWKLYATTIYGDQVYGAVWNDYAEYRSTKEEIEAGRVVIENGDDTLSLATDRLMPGANIVSDTFGFAIGETENSKTPLAVSGRALAYPYEDRDSYKPGDPVCSGPNGTISKMTREEVMMYPDRILGTVSAIPKYETWGTGNVAVNGRIWIKVK